MYDEQMNGRERSKEQGQLEQMRLLAAVRLAQAVKRRHTGARLGIAAATSNGFYYDLEVPQSLTEQDLAGIQEDMKRLASSRSSLSWRRVAREEAVRLLEASGEHLKAEWVKGLDQDYPLSLIEEGGFMDVLSLPLDAVQLELPAYKLLSVSGAYWLGDSSRPVLQRIYGAAFSCSSELEDYLAAYEEAQKRDHRKLGKQLQLFMFADEAPGMPFYLPKGTVIRNELEALSRGFLQKYGYEEVRTPIMMDRQMWEQSGHWDHYHENMYFCELDHHQFAVKPMNCPGHMLMFKNRLHSYKELPIRFAEFGQVHRHEFSGALNGLLRVRTFCQDDAHIFVRPDQIAQEIGGAIELIKEMYGIFGFEYSLELSTRPESSMGSDEQWEAAEAALSEVLGHSGLPYSLNPGDGAFYGPKIDFHIKDALNRSHQCATIQLDFQMPEKFGLSYVDERNERQTPIVIHRAVYGSIDRFLGILIEHYAGAFPAWLAPVQVVVIPVADRHAAYGAEVCRLLKEEGIRAELDERQEKLGYKIREAQLQKTPYIAVIGDKELADGSVTIRARGSEQQQQLKLEVFLSRLLGILER
ncbi:threonine--tRNA ligase [Paenibacillus tarimensis]|uniref:threonine--tRNA ligase n=1 Tax=Paenibacillus tarimensis TaxID=416012 RepID=UPI001EFF6720|nr:threonine--tRNA ligase [Paenibacillus tarimensis]MCF2944929.1 threonine--tRNA ligase [Paenibacillus tarimensis]